MGIMVKMTLGMRSVLSAKNLNKTMENIIKKAIEGEYPAPKGSYYYNKDGTLGGWWYKWKTEDEDGEEIELENPCCFDHPHYYNKLFLDPLFWQALGKECWWDKLPDGRDWDSKRFGFKPVWVHHALQFHEINLTQGFNKAVEWLEDLIK